MQIPNGPQGPVVRGPTVRHEKVANWAPKMWQIGPLTVGPRGPICQRKFPQFVKVHLKKLCVCHQLVREYVTNLLKNLVRENFTNSSKYISPICQKPKSLVREYFKICQGIFHHFVREYVTNLLKNILPTSYDI